MLNEQTLEFGQAKLKAKNSLRFTLRKTEHQATYLVEDELSGKFFQIGLAQYTFLSLLNGRRTVNSALEKTASLLRQHAFDQQQVANLCKWAIESGLVESPLGSTASNREKAANREIKQKAASWLNPITLKVPLFSPDAMIASANQFVGWLVSPVGAFLWLAVVGYGFLQLLPHQERFIANRANSISSNDVFWFAIAWLLLKLVHEVAHGLVCKRYGGRVSNCGLLLLLLIPLPFVDVTSSWRFDSKWQRILTSAAGMLSEIFIAAIACIVWVNANPGPLQYHASNIIIAATLHTLLFNANPLMRFDGYYMLSDWLEIPNLSTHGRQYVKGFFKWLYFGAKAKPLTEVGPRALIVKAYGFGTILWFFVISIGLSLAASSLLEGGGALVAAVGLLLWFGLPIAKFAKYTLVGSKTEQPNRKWFAAASLVTAVVVGGFLFACPSPSVVSAPVVIDYRPGGVVRAKVSGFANRIHVLEGQEVTAGQLLVTLENPELQSEYSSLLIDIAISELRIKSLATSGEIASVQIEEENLQSFQTRKVELQRLLSELEVRAGQAGEVIASGLSSKERTYFRPGDELLTIGAPQAIYAIAMVKQEDIRWIPSGDRSEVEISIWGDSDCPTIRGAVAKANPRARDDLPHSAFAASNGGPLAVVAREHVEGVSESHENSETSMMLTQPRVPVEITLTPSDQVRLLAGQSGMLFLRGRHETMADYLADHMIRFARKNNFRTHGL